MEQELITLLEYPSSPPIISGVRVIRSLVLCIMYCGSLFVLFLLAIVLFVLLLFTDSDYPFGIFKLFLPHINTIYTFWNLKMHLYYVYYDKCYWIMQFFLWLYICHWPVTRQSIHLFRSKKIVNTHLLVIVQNNTLIFAVKAYKSVQNFLTYFWTLEKLE